MAANRSGQMRADHAGQARKRPAMAASPAKEQQISYQAQARLAVERLRLRDPSNSLSAAHELQEKKRPKTK
jgi:hypothetical protein